VSVLKTATEIIEVPISEIKITTRLRRTDKNRVDDLCESIRGVGLLHPISVAKKDDGYVLLAGNHRVESFKKLNRSVIPAIILEANDLICSLVEVEENLCRSELNAIQTAEHIVKREELLVQLGRKAVVGNNQYTKEEKITNEDLARQMGYTRRTYQYKKSIANLNPEAKDLLCETDFSKNMMDMYRLQKEPDHIQLEIANLLITGKAKTFRRAWVLGKMKFKNDCWSDEVKDIKEKIGIPKSVMKWDRVNNELNDLCYYVSHSEETSRTKIVAQFGTNPVKNYSMCPEMSKWFINFFSKEGDLVLDNFAGRGTNIIAAAYEGRRVVGYDLSQKNLQLIESVCLEHTRIKGDELTLHHSCGVELVEYQCHSNLFDLVINDPPYIYGAEQYGNDERDLCLIKDLDDYNAKMERCLLNLKRLIKPSDFKKKIFHPIVLKVGSARRGTTGLVDMATELEIIARRIGLTLHDKIFNELKSAFQSYNLSKCIENRYTVKSHETSLVFVKYE